MTEYIDRRLYRLRSRNLSAGVYAANLGEFIGIRDKMGDRYLFGEGPTVSVAEDTGIDAPEGMAIRALFGPLCKECGRPARFDRDVLRWYHVDDDTLAPGCTWRTNPDLFDWLDTQQPRP